MWSRGEARVLPFKAPTARCCWGGGEEGVRIDDVLIVSCVLTLSSLCLQLPSLLLRMGLAMSYCADDLEGCILLRSAAASHCTVEPAPAAGCQAAMSISICFISCA